MSNKQGEFLPTALNRANDTSPGGFTDVRTGQDLPMGGTLLGDFLQLTRREAADCSDSSVALLYEGQYRRIYVDLGATAVNVTTGTAAYLAPGGFVRDVRTLTAGSGQTPGSYTVNAAGGGGTGASIQVNVSANGTASAVFVSAGTGYTTIPTFTLTGAGGTAATFQALMDLDTFKVTTADKAGVNVQAPRGVFLNPVTPGNYGWIQEAGVASVLIGGAVAAATVGASLTPTAGGNGTFAATAAPNANGWAQVGVSADVPAANTLCRAFLTLPAWLG